MSNQKRIAIVHDALVVPAGSERVALNISNIFPDAPIYTSVYLPDNTFPEFKNKEIHTLPFSKMIKSERQFKSLYPLWYMGFSFLDLSQYDIIISSANYLAKFINPPAAATHICYLHNPIRFLWKSNVYSNQSVPYGQASLQLIRFLLPILQKIDINKTQKIKNIITNSKNIAKQIQNIYQMKADVIYPPVDINSYSISETPADYYLYAGRLISHKRVDLAIEACNQLNRKLIIAGDGFERSNLEKIAGKTIQFLGRVTDEQLKDLYANCRAFIFPSDEDFGLVPVEAQASGRPVIAYRSGGALESVIEYETGLFFDQQNVESLVETILRFESMKFNSDKIRQNAFRFDLDKFDSQILAYVQKFT
jgi:glycosyltransferase involved in cell wall biosynthesis